MKVLQVIHDFVPETLAGAEINTHKLCVDLVAAGHSVSVFCRGWKVEGPEYAIRDEVLDGICVRRVDFGAAGRRNSSRRRDTRIEALFREYLDLVEPDLVHFQHFIYLSTHLVDIACDRGLPVVASLRNFWFRCPRGTRLYHDDTLCERYADLQCLSCLWPDTLSRKRRVLPWKVLNPVLESLHRGGAAALVPRFTDARAALDSLATWMGEFRKLLLRVDRVHVPSRFLADMVIDAGVPDDRVAVVPNGVAIDPDLAPTRAGTESRPLRAAVIGVARHKGTHVAVEAMAALTKENVEMAIYGQVADPSYLRRLEESAPSRVSFAGVFPPEKRAEIFRDLDVLVVPSIWYENCPTVILEAFASGVPVLTSGVGGMAEAVRDGVDGLHFRVGDPGDLASKLRRLARDRGELDRLRRNVRRPWSANEVSAAIETIYDEVIAARSAGTATPGTPTVSVVLATFNEARRIAACLEALAHQTVPLEVIVVDDGSTDDSAAVVERFTGRDVCFRLIRHQHQGQTAALNRGAREARGETLVLWDADLVPEPSCIEHLVRPIVAGECVGTFSKDEFVANFDNVWARCWNLHEGVRRDRRHPEDFPDEHTVFRAIGRERFLSVGGFDAGGSGADRTLAGKLGALARVAPGAVCHHHNPDSLAHVFRGARRYAAGGVRIPGGWRSAIDHTPPFSVARSLRRTLRDRNPAFPVFKVVFDLGVIAGLLDRARRRTI